jgi:H+/Cl- antiporter ClcA
MTQAHPEAPRWQLYLAALAGFAGFLWLGGLLLEGPGLHVALPAHTPSRDGTDMLMAAPAALAGGAVGLLFVWLLPRVEGLLARAGSATMRTLVGSALFAALCAAVPMMRFSGHDGVEGLLAWGNEVGMGALIALASLKTLAVALCLASGWRGGAVFPLLFAGAAAGAATVWLIPAIPVTPALVAGIGAAVVVGMGKPVAAALVTLLMIGPVAMGPFLVGAGLGWALSRLVPDHRLH